MNAEQKLYLNIIFQLIEDFAIDNPIGNEQEAKLAKIQAIAWFKGNSKDYIDICDFAGIDGSWLRKKVLTSSKTELERLINEFRESN